MPARLSGYPDVLEKSRNPVWKDTVKSVRSRMGFVIDKQKVSKQNETAKRVNIQRATEIGRKIIPKGLNQKRVRVLVTEVYDSQRTIAS